VYRVSCAAACSMCSAAMWLSRHGFSCCQDNGGCIFVRVLAQVPANNAKYPHRRGLAWALNCRHLDRCDLDVVPWLIKTVMCSFSPLGSCGWCQTLGVLTCKGYVGTLFLFDPHAHHLQTRVFWGLSECAFCSSGPCHIGKMIDTHILPGLESMQ
jgi:hypothetical protein